MRGIDRSSSRRSGRTDRTTLTVSSPLPASPTTSKPGPTSTPYTSLMTGGRHGEQLTQARPEEALVIRQHDADRAIGSTRRARTSAEAREYKSTPWLVHPATGRAHDGVKGAVQFFERERLGDDRL